MSITDPIKFDLPDELKTLGLSSVIIKSRNLLIDYNQKRVICTFSEDDWQKTKRSIENTQIRRRGSQSSNLLNSMARPGIY